MPYDKEYVIRLSGLDLGQLIDGLEARADAWRLTAVYLETGEAPDGFVTEECSDAEEARRISEHYQRIIRTVVEQWEGQRCALRRAPRKSSEVRLSAVLLPFAKYQGAGPAPIRQALSDSQLVTFATTAFKTSLQSAWI